VINNSSIQTQENAKTARVLKWNVSSPVADLLFNLSNILLVIGAAAVLIGTIGSIKIGAIREQFSNERIAANEAATARAIAESDIAKAENAKTELKLLEYRRTRREILGMRGNADAFVERIAPFRGTKFDIGHAREGREQWDFLWDLEPLLDKAGWVFIDWQGPQMFPKLNWTMKPHWYGIANVLNVAIELDPERRDSTNHFGNFSGLVCADFWRLSPFRSEI
jgi:hypothetical protein